jgi:hypothetical protein
MNSTISISKGNLKIGRVKSFSLPCGKSCPGASVWCKQHCYGKKAERQYNATRAAYLRNMYNTNNLNAWLKNMLVLVPEHTDLFRLHVAGDLFSAPYIRAWAKLVKARPNTKFWGYTRSWAHSRYNKALDVLRSMDNMTLFASVDESMGVLPDTSWRVAYVNGTPGQTGVPCPQQKGKVANCRACGICFNGAECSVIFDKH